MKNDSGTMCAVRSYHLLIYLVATFTACLLYGFLVKRLMGPDANPYLRFAIAFVGGYAIAHCSKRVFNWWRRVD